VTNLPAEQDDVLERVIAGGDLSRLKPAERMQYYRAVCESLGLNPLTQPFQYIKLNGRLTLYATRGAADQLRKRDGVSVEITGRDTVNGVYVVTARARDRDGRVDESTGAVSIERLQGDALANALMKAETKAKRRVTLSIVGLGWLDETELSTIPTAEAVDVDAETGEIDQLPSEPEPQAIAPEPNGKTWTQADRPYPPLVIAKALRQAAAARGDKPASEKQRLATRLALEALFADDGRAPQKRRVLTQYVYGVESSADLTSGQCGALLDWARITEEDDTGQRYYTPTEHAPAEAAAIVEAALEEPDEEEG